MDEPTPDFGLYDEPPRYARRILLGLFGFGSAVFVLGGVYFGALFMGNWRLLSNRQSNNQPIVVQVPGTGIGVSLPELGRVIPQLPARPADSDRAQPSIPNPLAVLPLWTDRERINVLLLGIDHRDDEPIDGSRSDTMMIVSVDPVSKSVVMVSLPRDLWISIPSFGEQRINVAHMVGGPELAMRAVSANFGMKITHYARIDFRGFEQIVTSLGGLVVDVERPIKDDEYPTEDYGVMRIYIPPGPQWMDGKTALQYARSRHSENDFGRARRQQRVLIAMREKALQPSVVFRAGDLLPLAQKTVSTSFSPLDLAKLAKLATEIDRERVVSLVIDTEYATPLLTADGADVLVPNRAAIQRAINQALAKAANAPPSAPSAASSSQAPPAQPAAPPPPTAATAPPKVEVLNGTGRQGLAAATANWLRDKGYEVAKVDSADRADYSETRFMAKPGRESAATDLASAIGIPSAGVQPLGEGDADIRLVLGQNYRLPLR